jgi:hypothetical protein
MRTVPHMERRTRRSNDCYEAIQYLVEALADRSNVSSVVLTADNGSIVAGTGEADEMRELATIAGPLLRGEPCEDLDRVTIGTDILCRRVPLRAGTFYLAALGRRFRRMPDALHGIARILDSTPAMPA